MLSSHLHAVEAMMNVRLPAASDQRLLTDLLSQAGADQRRWLVRHSVWVLGQLGCLLVAVGHRLQGLVLRTDATVLDYGAGR
jgi:hypothetical protein